jgi:hypothetical protein
MPRKIDLFNAWAEGDEVRIVITCGNERHLFSIPPEGAASAIGRMAQAIAQAGMASLTVKGYGKEP